MRLEILRIIQNRGYSPKVDESSVSFYSDLIIIEFDKNLANIVPDKSSFTVAVDGSYRAINSITLSTNILEIELDTNINLKAKLL